MTSIIPNRTRIEGKITSVAASRKDEFSLVRIDPEKLSSVGNFANLIEKPSMLVVEILISKKVIEEYKLKEGSRVSMLIRKTPKEIFAIPDSIEVSP
jgi:hypothetical protein